MNSGDVQGAAPLEDSVSPGATEDDGAVAMSDPPTYNGELDQELLLGRLAQVNEGDCSFL